MKNAIGKDGAKYMLKELLKERDLLPILRMNDGSAVTKERWPERRREMLDALEKYSYGHTPPAPDRVWAESEPGTRKKLYGGKVQHENLKIFFECSGQVFSFPAQLCFPVNAKKPPVILYIDFEQNLPNAYAPVEEIMDEGFALAMVCYEDMVNDKHFGDFSDGLARFFGTGEQRAPEEWGKIGMWAYGASRFLDYLLTREDLGAEKTAVMGHSRLGKTALWTAAQDERFWCAISNDSGYGGAATSKHGEGERVADFIRGGSWDWYCENFKNYTGDLEDSKPYDQSWLLAAIAPRFLCVGSAEKDLGADPKSEFLTTLWASSAWELLGEKGLITPDRMPIAGDAFQEGSVSYHMRANGHFLSREDWGHYMRFLKGKLDAENKD